MDCKSIQSSSSSQMICKHDVFVSFRGEDTRNNFTDYLFGTLRKRGIVAFRDETKLKKGEPISRELIQAIEGSRVLIVVFSENYASSTWCLQELEKIADCIEVPGQRVLPVFYDVNPSEVRKQKGNYGKAFAEYEERFKDLEMVQRWRDALTQVASLSGWDVCNKPQYGEIEKIVEEVTSTLCHNFSSLPNDLVGMQSRVEQLEELLIIGSDDDVRVVGICGMGGIGKTALATVLYNRICDQFGACCFIDDVSKIYEDYGPVGAQNQLLRQILDGENLQIYSLSKTTYLMRTKLRCLKAFIVLDNVDQVEQLEKLAVNREWLGAGSRILIISRDEHILRDYGVDDVYKAQLLKQNESLQLFCKKAFKCDDVMRNYEELTNLALEHAEGHPLAIKVLGSFLFGRDVSEWRSALARLRESPNKDIMDVLRISFDGLEEMEKEIFLDIACFFDNMWEESVKRVLDCCGFYPDIGIRVLIDKSLITNSYGIIRMHDLLKELGKSIVRGQSLKEPGKWSRLWLYKDLHNVMLEKTASENSEAIVVIHHPAGIQGMTTLRAEALSKMSRLRLLILCEVNFSGSLNMLSNELQYLSWGNYPFTCLPSRFQPDKLVELVLHRSNIKQLWEGVKPLYNLRSMDLSYSANLIKIADFRGFPNLEWLNLKGCLKLVHVDSSIELLQKLAYLNLKNCKSLISLPKSIFGVSSLEVLELSGCSKLFNNQLLEKASHAGDLKKLDISETATQCQSTSLVCKRFMKPFHFFHARRHKHSVGLLFPYLRSFPYLRDLNLGFCNLHQIPDVIGWLHCLEKLNLEGNNFVRLPPSIKELSKLINLHLEHCKQLKSLPELSSNIVLPIRRHCCSGLYIFNCPNLAEIEGCINMAFSWMIQMVQLYQEYSLSCSFPYPLAEIVIAGSQIPRWFDHRSEGGRISIESSPTMHDSNWIGIAVCVAFVAHDDPAQLGEKISEYKNPFAEYSDPNKFGTTSRDSIKCFFKRSNRLQRISNPLLINKDVVTVESEHLLVIYLARKQFIDILSWLKKGGRDGNGINFVAITNYHEGLRLEVKNCGLRWVFKQDLEELKRTMTSSGSSSILIHDH